LSGLSGCWRNWWYRSRISKCVAIRMPSLLSRFCFSCWSDVPIAQRRRAGASSAAIVITPLSCDCHSDHRLAASMFLFQIVWPAIV
jgi:hypothetical protein